MPSHPDANHNLGVLELVDKSASGQVAIPDETAGISGQLWESA